MATGTTFRIRIVTAQSLGIIHTEANAEADNLGLRQLDHLIVTHWHGDHFGGLPELAPKIPIKELQDIYDQAFAAKLIPTPVPAAQVMDYSLTDEVFREKR